MSPFLPQLTVQTKCVFVVTLAALLFYGMMFVLTSQLLNTTLFKLETKGKSSCYLQSLPPILTTISSPLGNMYGLTNMKNKLMIPSNDCLTAINKFPIFAKEEANQERRTEAQFQKASGSSSPSLRKNIKAMMSSSVILQTG